MQILCDQIWQKGPFHTGAEFFNHAYSLKADIALITVLPHYNFIDPPTFCSGVATESGWKSAVLSLTLEPHTFGKKIATLPNVPLVEGDWGAYNQE